MDARTKLAARRPRVAGPIKAKPRYSEVADQLMLNIITGTYPVGSLLPSEAELCQEYGVSRHTVREAVRLLQLRGMVARQQGRGTSVESDRHHARFSLPLSSIDEVERHGRFTHLVDLRFDEIVANEALAAALPCTFGERFLRIRSHRLPREASMPLPPAWNETYILARYANIRDQIEAWPGAIYSLVERRHGIKIVSIRQEATAVILRGDLAQRLHAKPGTAGLTIKRAYVARDGAAALFGFNTYVGDEFSLVMDLRRDE
jgi:GntR family transcriptional regulator